MFFRARVLMVASLVSLTGLARAEAVPGPQSLRIGHPLHEVPLRVESGESTTVSVANQRHQVPARGVKKVEAEAVQVGPGAAVGIVRMEAANGTWVLLIGGRSGHALLASGRSDWAGDPGERRMLSVERGDADAKGSRTVRVGTRYEALSLCGGRNASVGLSVVDPGSLELVTRGADQPGLAGLKREAATVTLSPPDSAPALPGLSAMGSSQTDPATRLLITPHALADGNPETRWTLRDGDFATLRWSAGALPIRRLNLRFSTTPPASTNGAAGGASSEVALLVLGDGDTAWEARLGPDALAVGSVAIAGSSPLTTRCVALVPVALGGAALEVASVQAFTELDEPGGLDKQLSALVQDGESGAHAADVLAALGAAGASAVAARYEELSPRGKRRALRVLAKGLDDPQVRASVVSAAREGSPDVSPQALGVLQAGGEAGHSALRELALEPTSLGDAAARSLAEVPGESAALLQAMSVPGASERPALRAALVLAARRSPRDFAANVRTWAASQQGSAARASLAEATAAAGAGDLTLALCEPLLGQSLGFADRYRCARALAGATASESADTWLEQQSLGAEEWMQRRVAFESLLARNVARAQGVADKLSSDVYPRVRAATFSPLLASSDWRRAADVAKTDAWPLVRVAAAKALSRQPEGREALVALLEDTSPRVRAAAILGLTEQRAQEAWPSIEKRLLDQRELPEVRGAAVSFAHELCMQPARQALADTVRQVFRPDADDIDARLALDALHALHDLGAEATVDAEILAKRDSAPPGLTKAHAGFGPPACAQPRGQQPGLQSSSGTADQNVSTPQ